MVDVTVVYWRDIPAQVIVGKGRRGSKVQLPERFEQAIDRAAMKTGAAETDDYLAEWRKAAPYQVEGDADDVARSEAARLDAEYDQDRIKALIANDGWANAEFVMSNRSIWEAAMALLNFRKRDTSRDLPVNGNVEAFLKDYSIEVMPRTAEKVEDFRDLLPKGTRVYIAHIEGTPD